MIYHLRVLRDIDASDLRAGDLLGFDPSDPTEPYTVCRAITPDPRAIIGAYVDGDLEAVNAVPASFTSSRARPAVTRVLSFPASRA